MAFKALFKCGGNEYNVLNCSYELHQETDATGRPSAVTRGGKMCLTIESTSDTAISDWMFNNFERKDGSIVFLKRDTDATSKELKFTEGYMVEYSENFDSTGENPMSESFVISAKTIAIGNGEHVNEWV